MSDEELKAQSEHFQEFIQHYKNIEEVKMYNNFIKNKFKFMSNESDKREKCNIK